MWKKNTLRNYEFILGNFQNHFGDIEPSSITSEDILAFMSQLCTGTKQSTKKLRFTLLAAFFNFVKNSLDPDFQNPCDNPALRKLFRADKPNQLKILDTKWSFALKGCGRWNHLQEGYNGPGEACFRSTAQTQYTGYVRSLRLYLSIPRCSPRRYAISPICSDVCMASIENTVALGISPKFGKVIFSSKSSGFITLRYTLVESRTAS